MLMDSHPLVGRIESFMKRKCFLYLVKQGYLPGLAQQRLPALVQANPG